MANLARRRHDVALPNRPEPVFRNVAFLNARSISDFCTRVPIQTRIATRPSFDGIQVSDMNRALGLASNSQDCPGRGVRKAHLRMVRGFIVTTTVAFQLAAATAGEPRAPNVPSAASVTTSSIGLLRLSFAMAATNWRFPDGKLVAAMPAPQVDRFAIIARMPDYLASPTIAVQLVTAESDARLVPEITSAPEVTTNKVTRRRTVTPTPREALRNKKRRIHSQTSADDWKMRVLFRD